MANSCHYLTVQDHLYINLQVAKKRNSWNFAKLEEAVYYQYGYGASLDILAQAARYAKGFIKNSPFADGNEGTMLIGLASFLKLNGYHLNVDAASAHEWIQGLIGSGDVAKEVLSESTHYDVDHHDVSVKDVVDEMLQVYSPALEALGRGVATRA